jgi:peptidoglycan hydrolase CwlO-like protein
MGDNGGPIIVATISATALIIASFISKAYRSRSERDSVLFSKFAEQQKVVVENYSSILKDIQTEYRRLHVELVETRTELEHARKEITQLRSDMERLTQGLEVTKEPRHNAKIDRVG